MIAACNPHRGDSLILESESWIKETYSVRNLHPTLKCLMWNFGSLTQSEEKDYVKMKIELISKSLEMEEACKMRLISLIVISQQLIREFAERFILEKSASGVSESQARDRAKSCVSQRDVERVFTFYFWLKKVYVYRPALKDPDQRAVLVALGLVYYLRLDSKHRQEYVERISGIVFLSKSVSFMEAFYGDINWLISQLCIPDGIAKTKTLKENLFATIVCGCTKVPLIVVGKPGTSKTLSFNLAVDNLKGGYSHNDILKNVNLFPALDPLIYQCSKQTTSVEIETLFKVAIKRQKSYSRGTNWVVFMDEAGLPEERHESLKILHQYLDEHKVSFVAVSNHILDAAKTNRAVSLVVPETTEEDLQELVKGCYSNHNVSGALDVMKYCSSYREIVSDTRWKDTFGLRDFIYFVHYLHRRNKSLTPDLALKALERNFNGTNDFDELCETFFQDVPEASCNIRSNLTD